MNVSPSPALKVVRIFVSSPGDVQSERDVAERVIRSLAGEFAGRVQVDGYFWEYEPMVVTSDFQDQIERPSSFDIVVCILWSRLGSRLHTKHLRPNGTPYSSGTEYEFEDAATANRECGRPDILLYVNRTPPSLQARTREERAEALRQIEALEDFLENWTRDVDEGTWKGAFTGYTDLARFEKLLDEHLRRLLLKHAPATAIADAVVPVTWKGGSPFRGLEAFDFEHSGIFFGRTRAIEDVLKALKRRRAAGAPPFALVAGMSGSGKSSLVRAGALPLLTRPGVVEGIGAWKQAFMRPGSSGACAGLLRALAEAGVKIDPQQEGPSDCSRVVEAVEHALLEVAAHRHADDRCHLESLVTSYEKEGRGADAQRCRSMLGALVPPEAGFALVIDQLEELFAQPAEERAAFSNLVAALLAGGHFWIMATMRADRFPCLRELPVLAGLCEGDGVYTLLPPDRTAIGQMIRRPAMAAGLFFEVDAQTGDRLDEMLRDGALNDPACLPLLQFTLEELYRRRGPGNILTLDAYRALGGIEGAIGRRAEEAYLAENPGVREALPRLMGAICDVGPGGAIRRWAPADIATRDPLASALADALVEARLLVRDIAPDGTAAISVAHEALFRAWPRAAEWCATNSEFLRLRGHLRAAAERWRSEGRRPDFLLAEGKPLADAEAILTADAANLDDETRGYIETSSRHRRLQRTKALRRFQAVAAVLTVLSLCAVSAAVFGFLQKTAAERRSAELRTALAEADLQLGVRLVASGAPDRALAPLARAAGSSDAAAWRAATLLRQRGWFLPDGPAVKKNGPVRAVAFSPDARLIAIADDSGVARIYDAGSGVPRGPEIRHGGAIWEVAFSPDGTLLATGSEDGTARLWNVPDGSPAGQPLNLGERVSSLGFSPDGKLLFTAGGDAAAGNERGALQVWNVPQSTPCGPRRTFLTEVPAAAFSPDGKLLAAGLLDGSLHVWAAETGAISFGVQAFEGAVECVGFDSAGRRLLVAGADNSAKIYDLAGDGRPTVLLSGHEGPVNCAVFSPTGELVATASADGTARLWDAGSGRLLRTMKAGGFVQSAVFSRDGRELLTVSQSPTHESSAVSSTLRLWDIATDDEILTPLAEAGVAHAFALDPDGRKLLVGWDDGMATLLGLHPADGLVSAIGLQSTPAMIAPAGEGCGAFAGTDATGWTTWVSNREGKSLWKESLPAPASALATLPAGKLLAVGLDSGSVLVRGVADGAAVPPAGSLGHPVGQLAFSPDGNWLAASPSTSDGEPAHVTVFNLRKPGERPLVFPHGGRVRDLQFSPDGRELLTACHDRRARVWELPSGRLRMEIPQDGMVITGSWSPDGKRVLLATETCARIHSASDGRMTGGPMDGTSGGGAAFSPSGDIVVTWSPAARPRLWHAESGRAIGRPLAHDGAGRPAFVAGGRFLVTASSPLSNLFLAGSRRGIEVWDVAGGVPVCDPIPAGDEAIHMCPVKDSIWFVNGTAGFSVLKLPPDTPASPWLALRATATGRWKMLDGGSLERLARPDEAWRQAAAEESAAGGPWQNFFRVSPGR